MDAETLSQYRRFNEQAIYGLFAMLGKPTSFLDVGCGDGWTVRTARMAGCRPARGITDSYDSLDKAIKWARVVVRDYGALFDLGRKFEMVICLNATAGMSSQATKALVDNLGLHSMHTVVFAPSDQSGSWRSMVEAEGFEFKPELTAGLRNVWRACANPMFWLQTVEVFQR